MTSDVEQVAEALAADEVVGIPTDTVYGLGARVTAEGAIEQIFELKGRSRALALPVLVSGLSQAEALLGGSDPRLERLARSFWPGALTVVAALHKPLPVRLGGDGMSVGLRSPDDVVVRDLCARVGPLAVTSANRHGEAPITSAAQFTRVFGAAVRILLDGGIRGGAPSSIVSIVGDEPRSLRAGPLDWSAIVAALGGVGEVAPNISEPRGEG